MPACIPAMKAIRRLLTVVGLTVVGLTVAGQGLAAAAPGFQYWNPADSAGPPKTLSAMGLFQDLQSRNKVLIPEARPYDVNSALWSDGFKMKRWVLLKPGTAIGFKERDDYWAYPAAAVFIKTYSIDTIPGDTNSRVLWDTRILLNAKESQDGNSSNLTDTWYAYSYRWDSNQKDARLVDVNGQDALIRVWPEGTARPSRLKKWRFPSRSQCMQCHRTDAVDTAHGRTLQGFFTAQLNRAHPDSVGRNQLDVLFGQGVLKGVRPSTWTNAPRWRAIDDNTANLDTRARSYIAANCSGCHGARGMSVGATFGVDHNYDFHTMTAQMNFIHKPVSWSFGLDDDAILPKYYPLSDYVNNPKRLEDLVIQPALVVPGYPQKSVILFRQLSRNTLSGTESGDFDPNRNQMPPLATFEVDRPATALIQKWILEMGPNGPTRLHGSAAPVPALTDVSFRGRTLVVAREALRSGARVSMLSLDGREVRLDRMGEGLYALPAGMPKGLYYVRIGSRTLLKSLL